jgi:hypothetical protein
VRERAIMNRGLKVYVNGVLLDSYAGRDRIVMLLAIRVYDPFQKL